MDAEALAQTGRLGQDACMLGLALYGLRLARSGSYLILAVPVVAAGIWFLVLTLGEQVLGWQA